MKAQFLDLHAAADFLGPGAIEVNRYQTEITDIVRRRGAFGQRIKQVPATGHPSRFFEQTAIVSPSAATAFVDPRNIVATVGSPTRVERSLPLKALVSQINYNLFDMEVGAQQSQFAFLQAKDLADSVEGLMRNTMSRCGMAMTLRWALRRPHSISAPSAKSLPAATRTPSRPRKASWMGSRA